ncbi:hypothetical protein PTTG_03869 [Puccinia triticina 1-1 BBBD Race 1]|uniref:Rho-GAP domain-containing protein n=1 Tax=Puccinia triticina (isolate 1-1 / race 1 (BBBD)) TaxID=630390 RepID=A0A180GS67_PUCT1|nr:hypothetical protein PTTG_03869 [Puccinia triticina 1-1 BBBD Race 1]
MASTAAPAEPGLPATGSPPPPNPKMPATFDRWFWTSDYRRGATILFEKINAGLKESQELIAFIRKRESFERAYAHELRTPTPIDPEGFGFDDGASFLSVYKQLRSSQTDLADAHARLALQLDRLVIGPFETWSRDHQERITKAIDRVELILSRWEKQAKEVVKLKEIYDSKTQEADEAEEDSRFSPAGGMNHHQGFPSKEQLLSRTSEHTLSESAASPRETYGQISKLVSEQAIGLSRAVTQKMRIQDGRLGFKAQSLSESDHQTTHEKTKSNNSPPSAAGEKPLPQSPSAIDSSQSHPNPEKGKSKEEKHMTAPAKSIQSSTLLNIAGVVKPPIQWSQLFQKARDTIFKQSIKVPLLGTYQGAHSGEDLVIFFKNNLSELNGDPDRAIEFCRELSQQLSILRLIGEIGNKFIASHDAFYVWKPEAFTLHSLSTESGFEESLTDLPERRHLKSTSLTDSPSRSPRLAAPSSQTTSPNGLEAANKQATVTGSALGKYLQTAVSQAAKGINELSATVGVSTPISAESPGETRAERLGREARSAEKAYSTGVHRLDHTRLLLEQTISEYFQFLQRCELDRLRAAKAVIMGFNAALATLNPKMEKLAADAVVLNESFSPEGDVSALVERYRTGPFRPSPVLFHSYRSHETRVNFGIDLSKWHNCQHVDYSEDFNDVPPILTRLIALLEKGLPRLANDDERRMTWIYEVPLKAIHELREALNDPYRSTVSDKQLEAFDPPLIAATIKLWLLELDPPPVHSSRYDDVKAIYPQRAGIETRSVDVRVEVLAALLSKLPKPHLMVIDTVISHLRNLFISTKSSEDDELYLAKLGLSIARTLLRPKVETAVSLSDRFQPLFVVDLIKYYERILPVAIGLRNKMMGNEVGKKPQRKNTRPTDMRIRRSELGIEGSIPDNKAQKILADQRRRVSQVEASINAAKSGVVASPTSPQSVIVRSVPATAENSPVETKTNKKSSEEDRLSKEINTHELSVEEEKTLQSPPIVVNEVVFSPPAQVTSIQSPDQTSSVQEQLPTGESLVGQPLEVSDDEEARDAPFVPPTQSGDNPVDLPFVPPTMTNSSLANEIISSYGEGASSSEIDEQDIPLAAKANLNRLSSHEKISPGGASLNRKRGLVGSPKTRNPAGKLAHPAGSPPLLPSGPAHSKGAPSVGSLRSQFESSTTVAASNRQSLNSAAAASDPSNPIPNRYRRAHSKV